jgi:DNA-binding transcriptional LysR family regulator
VERACAQYPDRVPSFRALECFVAVADSGSITDAARVLFSSQSAISHHLSLLEREVGTTLFHREARGVRLTTAGRASLPDARRALSAAASVASSAQAVGRLTGGTLRLACAQSLITVFAPIMQEWHRSAPQVSLTLRESTSAEELHGFLDKDEVDLVLMPGPGPERFVVTDVAEEEIVLSASVDHRLAAQGTVTVADLDGVRLVSFSTDNGLSVWLDQSLAQAGVQPTTVMRTAVTAIAPQLAAAGMGVAVTPVSALGDGFPGAVRSFSPGWFRDLVVLTLAEPETLAARFIDDLRRVGVRVPPGVAAQLHGGLVDAP